MMAGMFRTRRVRATLRHTADMTEASKLKLVDLDIDVGRVSALLDARSPHSSGSSSWARR